MASSAPALSCPSRSAASQARPRLVLTPSHFGSAGGLLCTRESMRQIFTRCLLTPPTFRARRTGRRLNTVHLQLVSASERASTRVAIDPTRAHRPDRRPLAMPARACSRPLVSACVRSRPLVSARVRSCQLVSARVLSICPLVSTLPVCAVSGNQQRHDTSHAQARPLSRVVGPWRCDRAQRRGSSVCAVPPSQGGFHQI